MQKSMYHEFHGNSKKRNDALMKNLAKLDEVLVRRQVRTSLDIQELSTEFTNDIAKAWINKVPMKV